MEKMIETVSIMPKGIERDSKWQKVLTKGAELNKAKSIINRIEAFNNHDKPEKIVDEVMKLSDSLPQNYIKSLQPLGGGSRYHTTGMVAKTDDNSSFKTSTVNKLHGISPEHVESRYLSNLKNNINIYKLQEPTELWDKFKFETAKIAGHPNYPIATDFAHNSLNWLNNITNNTDTRIVNSIKEISDPKLRAYIQDRVNQVLQRQDCRGLIFSAQSDVSTQIQHSSEFKEVIYRNKNELFNKNIVMLKPITFYKDIDLKNAIHNATLYKAWIDKDGNLNAIIYDIYDFNKINNRNDIVAKVNNQMEYWQEHRNIENYFILVFVKINRS